jgi:hypothetical protein
MTTVRSCYKRLVNHFIISMEIGAEFILSYLVVHHLRLDRDGGFVNVRMYLFLFS